MPVRVTLPLLPVVVDTRERAPWEFDPARCTTARGTLAAGDYSIAGHEHAVGIERKSLDDYVQTIIHARERYERELARFRGYALAGVVVESGWADVFDRVYTSRAHPNAVFGLTCCLIVDYRVPVYFLPGRALATRFAERLLRRYWERVQPTTVPG